MPRYVVLPYGVEPREKIDRADLLLGRPLSADLAERLIVRQLDSSPALDAEAIDPLSLNEPGGLYLYSGELAGELAPLLTERLGLDGLIFGRLKLEQDGSGTSLELAVYDGKAKTPVWRSSASRRDYEVQSLNIDVAQALQAHLEIEPSARERTRQELVTTTSITALRMVALAEAMKTESAPMAMVQRIRLFDAALREDSRFIDAVTGLAETKAAMGDIEGAQEVLDDWLRAYSGGEGAHFVRLQAARMALRCGAAETAVTAARSVADEDPYSLDAMRLLSSALIAAGRPDEAAFSVREALWRFPGDLPMQRTFGLALLASQEIEEATALFATLVLEHPDHGGLSLELGHALELSGRIDDALATYRHALSLGTQLTAEVAAQIAHFLVVLGFPAEAIAVLSSAEISRHPAARLEVGAYLAVAGLTVDAASVLGFGVSLMGESWLDGEADPGSGATFLNMELGLLRSGAIDGIDAVLETWRSQVGDPDSVDGLKFAWWTIALAVRNGEIDEAARIWREVRSTAGRDALRRRLLWLRERARWSGDAALVNRALELLLEVDEGSHRDAVVEAAEVQLGLGAADTALLWLGPVVETDASAEAVDLAAAALCALERADEAAALVEANDGALGCLASMRVAVATDDETRMVGALRAALASELPADRLRAAVRELSTGLADAARRALREAAASELPAGRRAVLAQLVDGLGADVEVDVGLDGEGAEGDYAAALVALRSGDEVAADEALARASDAGHTEAAAVLAHRLLGGELDEGQARLALRLLQTAFVGTAQRGAVVSMIRRAAGCALAWAPS